MTEKEIELIETLLGTIRELRIHIVELEEQRDRWKQHYEYSRASTARLDYIRQFSTDPVVALVVVGAVRFALKASAQEVFDALESKEEQKP